MLARVLAARGIVEATQLSLPLSDLLPPSGLSGIDQASTLVVDAILRQTGIVIAGDYDCDGATGVAVATLGLKALGANAVDYVVPDRLTMGYGLSPLLARQASETGAKLLLTVDNGIASIGGVAAAKELGMSVLVTDHHLPGDVLPDADAIVNPNQPDCDFGSKQLAGVGVMFYLLLAVRAKLRVQGFFTNRAEPNLGALLDLVALGTVADLVSLDRNNRILVSAGIEQIRRGRARPGLRALLKLAGRNEAEVDASALGFVLGPRINAAGRLDNISIGIECLLAEDGERALALATQLDQINRTRRKLQTQSNDVALDRLAEVEAATRFGVCLFDADWHEGVVGLVASRLKEHTNRPSIAFARSQQDGELKGSARSVPGMHLRDVLATIDAREPGMMLKFGGHAMAAGLSLRERDLERFSSLFDTACQEVLHPAQLERVLETDGPLDQMGGLELETALLLAAAGPWGQGMPEPMFDDVMQIRSARTVGADQRHVRYQLGRSGGDEIVALDFGGAERMLTGGRAHLCYTLTINRWRGKASLELLIAHLDAKADF